MKKDRYLNLDVEFLPSRKDTIHVEEKTYGVTFSQKDNEFIFYISTSGSSY